LQKPSVSVQHYSQMFYTGRRGLVYQYDFDEHGYFSCLRAENDRSAVALDTGIVRHKQISLITSVNIYIAFLRFRRFCRS
jgi:hypothetical protein